MPITRLTKRKEDLPQGATCRIDNCLMADFLVEAVNFDFDYDNCDYCNYCPFIFYINQLAEYEDMIETIERGEEPCLTKTISENQLMQ